MIKTIHLYRIIAVLLACFSSCGATEEAATDASPAVGAIFINSAQALPENEKVYANHRDHSYTFDALDAACVYYYAADEEAAYAGTQRFCGLRFAADIDADTVGAAGTIAYRARGGEAFSVRAYYLYCDEAGMYFDAGAPFAASEITDACVLTGTSYACEVTFAAAEPTDHFIVTQYDANHAVLSAAEYKPSDVEDYQRFDLHENAASAEVTQYSADGSELSKQTITPDASSLVICYDDGGRILPSKALRWIWAQP